MKNYTAGSPMKTLHPIPKCVDCLMSLTKTATALAAPGDPEAAIKAELAARQILENAKDGDLTSPQITNRILREIQHITGVADPYVEFKNREMVQGRRIFARLRNYVRPDLQSRVRMAILGNNLDFFKNPEETLAEIPSQMRNGISFYYDDVDRLESFLSKNPALALYLTDNAGEIYFDLPLYEYIRRRCKRAVLVVKGGPSLNDLTRAEVQSAKLEGKFEEVVDTGTDGAGIDWDRVSKGFLELVASADLVVSKGMANFETIYPKDLPPASFFLFKVKCEPIQDYVNAPAGSFLALWRDGQRIARSLGQAASDVNEK